MKTIAIIGREFWLPLQMTFGITGSVKRPCMKLRHMGHCQRVTEVLL